MNYDESLSQNPFFQHIETYHKDIVKKAAEENWIICVPRLGTFDCSTILHEDVLDHILVPGSSSSSSHFHSLNKKQEVVIEDKTIIFSNRKRIKILFEETFYIDRFTKYILLCTEKPLSRKSSTPEYNYSLVSLQECIRLLQEKHLNLVEYIHKYLENVESGLETNDIHALKNNVSIWYKDIMKNCDASIKIAIETYIQHILYNKLFSVICNCTAESDASFNKIIRNSSDIQLKDLELNEYIEGMTVAKFEFSCINNYTTILDKVFGLKRALKAFSFKTSKLLITGDVTLKIFVFLIIKSNVNNWIANLIYVSQFKYMVDIFDEHSFLVTTLEAAIEFIKTGKLHQNQDLSSMQLYHYIKVGDLDAIKNYVQNESFTDTKCHPLCNCHKCSLTSASNLHSCDDKGLTALHVSCFYGHAHTTEYLISRNVVIDCVDYSEMMPLHYAALKGHQNALLLVLHAGAYISPKNGIGNTPLHLASNNGHENCVKALLYFAEQQGSFIDINCANNFGDTPLHLASKWGFCNIVNILIQYGADRCVKNKRSQTALDVAQSKLLKNLLLFNKTEVMSTNIADFTRVSRKSHVKHTQVDLLLKSVENNDTPLMCFYLGIPMPQIAYSSNLQSIQSCHPLCNCESCTHKQSVNCDKTVSKKPLSINASNADGFSALHVAALYDNTDILRLLLDSGAGVNIRTKNLCTPLHLACINQCTNSVRELLKCGGCEMDPQDVQGNTPLHYAAINNNSRSAEILLSNASNYNVKNSAGKTPIQIAKDKAHFNIVRLFSNKSDQDNNSVSSLFP